MKDISWIVQALGSFSPEPGTRIYLFGSRVKDHLGGGDIDLLLLSPNSSEQKRLRGQSHFILSAIKKGIGDQKIDLKMSYPQECSQDPFLKEILSEAKLLFQW